MELVCDGDLCEKAKRELMKHVFETLEKIGISSVTCFNKGTITVMSLNDFKNLLRRTFEIGIKNEVSDL